MKANIEPELRPTTELAISRFKMESLLARAG